MKVHQLRRMVLLLIPMAFALGTGGVIAATTFVEDFETGGNEGGWTFGNSFESITQEGTRPGYFLRNVYLDTFAPWPSTNGAPSAFTGDYRARNVTLIGVDFRIFNVDITARGRQLSLILTNDSGTPGDASDDCGIYTVSPKYLPHPGRTWKQFDFVVPSALPVMPPQWGTFGNCGALTDDEVWNLVITDVDTVSFFGGDPTFFYIFQLWDVAIDNPSITSEEPTTTGS